MYRGYYRGGPCFGFGGFFLLGGAFLLGTMYAGGHNHHQYGPFWTRNHHHYGCQCPDCMRRLEYKELCEREYYQRKYGADNSRRDIANDPKNNPDYKE
ncbi:hypothetical protein Cantr_03656 [Candida viswanathii]|uniref:Uncharacterized protein n=1 Tax=Candida viswanathii TaxID=5486 RepID=A0A367XNL4_9ASCO|nr:hypothetical protein Cantr_03656 [Candida viswanathii]